MSNQPDGRWFELPLTIREACVRAASILKAEEVEEPRNNAELLLMFLLVIDRAVLLRDGNEPFPADRLADWEQLIRRKALGEPVQYMIGEQWFYGRPFAVSPAVLIPRPETELLVEAVLEAADRLWPSASGAVGGEVESGAMVGEAESGAMVGEAESGAVGVEAESGAMVGEAESGAVGGEAESGAAGAGADRAGQQGSGREWAPTVVDVGTGSGAIAVTLASQRPRWRVSASDLSPDALAVARTNAARHDAADRMTFVQGDLLAPFIPGREKPLGSSAAPHAGLGIDVLVSNPPYIPAADLTGLQREVRDYEPHLALDGGADGLVPYRRMLEQLPLLAQVPRIVAFELGMGQPRIVADMMQRFGAWDDIRIISDYAGIERHVIATQSQPR